MNPTLPSAKSACFPNDRDELRRVVARRNLCGLANDTKWDEFITAIRTCSDWKPSYRCKCIDGPPSEWDGEWAYHLPFPLLSVEWMDLKHLEVVVGHRSPPRLHGIDHSSWMEKLLREIGLDYRKGEWMIRIFGYFPRSMELFDQE